MIKCVDKLKRNKDKWIEVSLTKGRNWLFRSFRTSPQWLRHYKRNLVFLFLCFCFFFYQSFLIWTLTIHRTAGEVRGDHLFSFPPLLPAPKHSDIYLHLSMWDNSPFLIASYVITRMLLDGIYHLWELAFCLFINRILISVYLVISV